MSLEALVPYYLNVGDPVEKGLGGELLQPCNALTRHCYLVFKSTYHCLYLYFVVDDLC